MIFTKLFFFGFVIKNCFSIFHSITVPFQDNSRNRANYFGPIVYYLQDWNKEKAKTL